MTDAECQELLRWAAPRLGLRLVGFRRVRGQVCKRVGRRMKALGVPGLSAYLALLEEDATERALLDALCRVTVSRFYRDQAVFDALREPLLPQVLASARARGETRLRVWSAGCASGEEPYSVSVLFRRGLAPRFPDFHLELVATDADAALLERARRGCYSRATLRELPSEWVGEAFTSEADEVCLRPEYREGLDFRCEDLREQMPEGPFHLVLCRNVAFTYFAPPVQQRVLAGLMERLVPGGLLVIGSQESLPEGALGLARAAGPDAPLWFRQPPREA
ncbi:CheR family methyltransferase [Melittangium boletus]|uniref:Chemotaxis protein CheR n=1 Tax=Melittangium boletus DSM 14713 TaxID=1294270 RepID=A0A250IEJ1_9BACT|nr:CheR family methyltransferase [Melittangium boletus]ATB29366.1 chemotaxis protein CheR [Melittangium boletus DSM 14713]